MRLLATALLLASTTAALAASAEGEWVTEGDKAPCSGSSTTH